MKINDNTLSITPLIRNILPLIIYDGYYPIFSYEEMTNVSFLNLTLGIGTTTQINNYLKKQKSKIMIVVNFMEEWILALWTQRRESQRICK
jgi:hypothetical protein